MKMILLRNSDFKRLLKKQNSMQDYNFKFQRLIEKQFPFVGTYGIMFNIHCEIIDKENWDFFEVTLSGTLICLN